MAATFGSGFMGYMSDVGLQMQGGSPDESGRASLMRQQKEIHNYRTIHGVRAPYDVKLSMEALQGYISHVADGGQSRGASVIDGYLYPEEKDILLRLRKETKEFIGDRKISN